MARDNKDLIWNVGKKGTNGYTADTVHHCCLAVLMDIRDELKEINKALQPLQVLNCHNFLRIPAKLDRIGRNTQRKRKPKTRQD